MKFTNYVLDLLAKGELSKEASLDALAMSKEASDDAMGSAVQRGAPMDWKNVAAISALTYGIPKAIDYAERGVKHLMSGRNQAANNSLFQQLMQQHPNLQGKDPLRAKANFDYIMNEAPHMAEHPMLLGDQVANFTSMGTTDPATLNMLATMTKSRNDARGNDRNDNANAVGQMVAKNYLLKNEPALQGPSSPAKGKKGP